MSIRRSALGLLLLAFCCTGVAADWPSGSCAGTLQACVDANSFVQILSDGPINENISISSTRTLVAAAGYKPTFTAGRNIFAQINGGGPVTVRIEGLTLDRGNIRVLQLSGDTTAYIRNNVINDTIDGDRGIFIESTSSSVFTAYVENNIVTNIQTSPHATVGGGIQVATNNITDATVQIYANTVRAYGPEAKGIWVLNSGSGELNADVIGNTVYGGAAGSIYLQQPNNSGAELDGRVVSNAVLPLTGEPTPYGIGLFTEGASSDFTVVNNTVTDAQYGVLAVRASGTQTGTLMNNLLAYNTVFGVSIDGSSSISNSSNLVHGNAGNSYVPGANTVVSSPNLLAAGSNNRLRDDSPAVDAADALIFLALGSLPYVDADGLYRLNGSGLDIGAFESGRHSLLHRASANSTSHISGLDQPWLNGEPNLHLFVMPVYDSVNLIDNPHALGVYYASTTWRLFNQDLVNIPSNAQFSVFHSGGNAADFLHSHVGSGSATSTIDRSGLNNQPDRILAVTQNWNGAGVGVYNDANIGVLYGFGQWAIINLDLSNVPDGADFNVYYQDASANAFEHIVTPGTKRFSTVSSEIDHPLLNGNECAQFTYTYSGSQGVFADNDFIAFYRDTRQRWHIARSDGSGVVPDFAAFHIIVDPQQVADCTDVIFEDTLGG